MTGDSAAAAGATASIATSRLALKKRVGATLVVARPTLVVARTLGPAPGFGAGGDKPRPYDEELPWRDCEHVTGW